MGSFFLQSRKKVSLGCSVTPGEGSHGKGGEKAMSCLYKETLVQTGSSHRREMRGKRGWLLEKVKLAWPGRPS